MFNLGVGLIEYGQAIAQRQDACEIVRRRNAAIENANTRLAERSEKQLVHPYADGEAESPASHAGVSADPMKPIDPNDVIWDGAVESRAIDDEMQSRCNEKPSMLGFIRSERDHFAIISALLFATLLANYIAFGKFRLWNRPHD